MKRSKICMLASLVLFLLPRQELIAQSAKKQKEAKVPVRMTVEQTLSKQNKGTVQLEAGEYLFIPLELVPNVVRMEISASSGQAVNFAVVDEENRLRIKKQKSWEAFHHQETTQAKDARFYLSYNDFLLYSKESLKEEMNLYLYVGNTGSRSERGEAISYEVVTEYEESFDCDSFAEEEWRNGEVCLAGEMRYDSFKPYNRILLQSADGDLIVDKMRLVMSPELEKKTGHIMTGKIEVSTARDGSKTSALHVTAVASSSFRESLIKSRNLPLYPFGTKIWKFLRGKSAALSFPRPFRNLRDGLPQGFSPSN